MSTSPSALASVVFYGPARDSLAKQAAKSINNLDLRIGAVPGAEAIIGTTGDDRVTLEAAVITAIGDGRGQWALTPAEPVQLVAFDVDSTLVNGEVIDMIAAHRGVGQQVAAVTQAAMEGKLDFNASLRERVALLEGCPIEVLGEIHDALPLNPGARELMDLLHDAGIATMMVSGGFTAVTTPLAEELGMVACYANTLEVHNGHLTGRVTGEIINGEAKRAHVLAMCDQLGLSPSQACCVGDGANDLLMMHAVGTGIAYNAKPIVQAQATIALNEPHLTLIAPLLGLL